MTDEAADPGRQSLRLWRLWSLRWANAGIGRGTNHRASFAPIQW